MVTEVSTGADSGWGSGPPSEVLRTLRISVSVEVSGRTLMRTFPKPCTWLCVCCTKCKGSQALESGLLGFELGSDPALLPDRPGPRFSPGQWGGSNAQPTGCCED